MIQILDNPSNEAMKPYRELIEKRVDALLGEAFHCNAMSDEAYLRGKPWRTLVRLADKAQNRASELLWVLETRLRPERRLERLKWEAQYLAKNYDWDAERIKVHLRRGKRVFNTGHLGHLENDQEHLVEQWLDEVT